MTEPTGEPGYSDQLQAAFRRLATRPRIVEVPERVGDGGRFVVDPTRPLGSGGLGTVYPADDTHTGNQVVVKFLRDSSGLPPAAVEQRRREILHLGRVCRGGCKHLAVPIEFGRDGSSRLVYLVTSFVPGTPLHRVPANQLTSESIETWMRGINSALKACHEGGIRHGDVKPENIMVEDIGGAVLVDLGQSVPLDRPTESTGGTPDYESLEHLWCRYREAVAVGAPSDIYSFGVTFGKIWERWERHGWGRRRPRFIRSLLEGCNNPDPAQRPTAVAIDAELSALVRRRKRLQRALASAALAVAIIAAVVAGGIYRGKIQAEQGKEKAEQTLSATTAGLDDLLKRSRDERAGHYELVFRPSARAVREVRLLGAPPGDRVAEYRGQVVAFGRRLAADRTPADDLVLVLVESQLALFEGRAVLPELYERRWDAIAGGVSPRVVADLHELRGLGRPPGGDATLGDFTAALAADPERSILHVRMAAALTRVSRHTEAERELGLFLGKGGRGVGNAVRARTVRDVHWIRAATLLEYIDDPDGAVAEMEQYFAALPTVSPRPDPEMLAYAHKTLAEAALKAEQRSRAVTEFEHSIVLYQFRPAGTTLSDDDRLFLADCYSGIAFALGTTNPEAVEVSAAKAVEFLGTDNGSQPFAKLRARIALYRGLARLRSTDPRAREQAATDLAAAQQGFEAVGIQTLTDAEKYDYAITLVKRAGEMIRPPETGERLDLYRSGVGLLAQWADRHPRHSRSVVPPALAFVNLLVARAESSGGDQLSGTRAASCSEAIGWCQRVDRMFDALRPGDFDTRTGFFLRATHRVLWFRAARAGGDDTVRTRQANAFLDLCLAPAGREHVAALSQNPTPFTGFVEVIAEDTAVRYLASPELAAAAPRRCLQLSRLVAPERTSWRVHAAAAAAYSRDGMFQPAVDLQRQAIARARASADADTTDLYRNLARYEDGRPYER